jgi:hypothetical protein
MSNRRNRSVAQRAFHVLRANVAELYNKDWSAHQIMDESHRILSELGIHKACELRSKMLVAAWNLCNRPNTPSIHDMLANGEQFDVPMDTPALDPPWWEFR